MQKTLSQYVVLGLAALACVVLFAEGERAPFASAETRFVEKSAGGLNIVPASCPSSPHYSGECSGSDDDPWWEIDINNPPIPPVEGVCPVGYFLLFGQCIFYGCPFGYHLEGGQCVPDDTVGQCIATYFCVGNNLHHRDAQCVETGPVQTCAFGCSGGGCLLPPPGSGDIIVQPSLLKAGERTTVSWTTENMVEDSCTVGENNPGITDSGSGENGSFLSSEIWEQTVYALTCEEMEGGTFTDSAIVNVIPIFQEN